MPKVLFVCTGNICRSAFAERMARSLSDGSWQYASAGTGALVGSPVDPPMARELEARGGSADGFAAQQVTPELVRDADLVLCMTAAHRAWLVEEVPRALRRTALLTRFAAGLADQPTAVGQELVRAVLDSRPDSRHADIADPYRRGDEAAATAAREIALQVWRIVRAVEG